MKKLFFLAIVCVAFAATSCSMLKSSSNTAANSTTQETTASAAQTAGTSMGQAIHSLYNEYKTTKTIDYKNPNTYVQVASFAANAATLKQNYKDASFYSAFAQGLMSGSNNLVNSDNVDDIITTVVEKTSDEETAEKASSTMSSAASAVNSASSAVSTLQSIFSSFK